MKLSDYVAQFIADLEVEHVFAITGGASAHLIDSVAKTSSMRYICPQHEQAGAMMADAYARTTGRIGVAMATSGPGATNMLTGTACAFYDSVPVLYITGQVSTFRLRKPYGVRQLGFQEADTADIFKPVTKYAVLVSDPARIRYELEKAVYLARSGRPGPVLVDIPDNVQRESIEPDRLESFSPPAEAVESGTLDHAVKETARLLMSAKRPVLILGTGIRLCAAETEAKRFVDALGIPFLLTWGALDLIPHDHPLNAGTFGTHGTRYGNFTVQNADLIVSVGSRLDTHMTGSPITAFAREARRVVVDIDETELARYGRLDFTIDVPVRADAKQFLSRWFEKGASCAKRDIAEWQRTIHRWKTDYPIHKDEYDEEEELNPYTFFKALSSKSGKGDLFCIDTGCALAWMMQVFECKNDQRLFSAFNNTPMGYALPAAIGACFARDGRKTICISGDGGLQMNIQELATIQRHDLPIVIFVINNKGYSMIQQTQDQWLDSRYEASTIEGGLGFPDFGKVARAYDLHVVTIRQNAEVHEKIMAALHHDGPVLCDVHIDARHRVVPQVKYGRPIEDGEPLLDREEFLENMIVKPLDVSLKPLED